VHDESTRQFATADRRQLFLDLAKRAEGVSATEAHRMATAQGDTVTEEAYYNLARRLVHRGLVTSRQTETGTRFFRGAGDDNMWLEEEDLVAIVDPEYPLLALPIWRETQRQVNDIPADVWVELRERLRNVSARDLFADAIASYADDLHAQVAFLVEFEDRPAPDLPRLRQEAENSRQLLMRITKYGLGLSREAVDVPLSLDAAMASFKATRRDKYVDSAILGDELQRRVANEPFVVDVDMTESATSLLIAAVDGSTRSGMMSFIGDDGDLSMGHAPMLAINTAIGQTNRMMSVGNRSVPVFLRLPEKPEDMQRADNRYSVMAKLLYPDLSDAEYMHSVWNAMDLLEARTALRLCQRWYTQGGNVEVRPADLILRDGTVSPQDRDFSHYADLSSYGKIVRDMIETNWQLARTVRDNEQTLAGVVKTAQLTVFAPVVNWYACRIAAEARGQIVAWPLQAMNLIPDQLILTRLLTAKRAQGDPWTRTAVVIRPFHALSNFSKSYQRDTSPSAIVRKKHQDALGHPELLSQEQHLFWSDFRLESDPFVKMLDNVAYGNFFLGAVPRLDIEKQLPRIEFLIPASTAEEGSDAWPTAAQHRDRVIRGLQQTGFQVSAEHRMFQDPAKIDVLPAILIRAHDTVKMWATELLSRVQEYVGYYLARHVQTKRIRGVRVRPFTRAELELLYDQLRRERELRAGRKPPDMPSSGPERPPLSA
jgi:hypothetical protein